MRSIIRSVGASIFGFFEVAMSEVPTPLDWSTPEMIAARDEFHKAFGGALVAWSAVEDGLCEWFKRCTALDERVARAVFYSARSFAGRRDMLIGALPLSNLDEKTSEGIRQCAKRARAYSEFRNRI